MKTVDAVLGKLAASLIPSPHVPARFPVITSLLIIRPGGIGDAVLLAPILRLLAEKYPAARITILAERRNAGVFTLITGIENVYCYDCPREFLRVLRGKYDVVIDSEQWHHLSAVVARSVSAPVKIGYATNERRRMFTHLIPYSHDDYESDSFIHLLDPMGIGAETTKRGVPFLTIPDGAGISAEQLLEPFRNHLFVTIFPGASIIERRWGADRYRRVVEVLSSFGIKVVVVGGKEDVQQGAVITAGGLGLNLAGLTLLSETAAVIRKSVLLLCGDSGLLHIAVGLGVPTVSLFGSGRAKKWAPQGEIHLVLNKKLPCSPCTTYGTTPPCPIDCRCMKDIAADEVVNAVTMLLTSVAAMPSHCCKRDWIETA
jgi:ADP-heptose:LPS heptosyltransferase